ncbi:thiaminase II [Streptomyces sp. NPDC058257]|uniref:thiaminase II n=1 Tax=Streptomyces sp. NPDC058257 TaxID=3346409 RepID=UPI0036E02117
MTTTFCDELWTATAEIRAAIDKLPFVTGLGDGTLDREKFVYYLAQDAHYLRGYARALAGAAAKADRPQDIAFFAKSAHDAVVVESSLHESNVVDVDAWTPSPTGTGYTSYLLSVAHTQGYPELAAAVLPCFWIYAEVGRALLEQAGDLAAHPYGDWIGTYADEEFEAATEHARQIVNRLADQADPATRARMRTVFTTASTWEWMFWDAAWRVESWPFDTVPAQVSEPAK